MVDGHVVVVLCGDVLVSLPPFSWHFVVMVDVDGMMTDKRYPGMWPCTPCKKTATPTIITQAAATDTQTEAVRNRRGNQSR